jgi:hypothetical protein
LSIEEAKIIISDNIELFDRAERYYRAKKGGLFRAIYREGDWIREYLRKLTPKERTRALRTIVRERRLLGRFVSYETQSYARDILTEERARRRVLRQIDELKSLLETEEFEELVKAGIETKEGEIDILNTIARSFRRIGRPDWAERTEALRKEVEKNLEELRKLIKNKLVAIHKRWFYKSPRGSYHDISIEGVASIVIKGTEKKEDYEEKLRTALEDHLYSLPGFERLTELTEEVVGFEEKPTDEPTRDISIETLEWWHKVFGGAQLKLEDFMR